MDKVVALALARGIEINWPDKIAEVFQSEYSGEYFIVVEDKYKENQRRRCKECPAKTVYNYKMAQEKAKRKAKKKDGETP